jgi:hypothetical protein
LAETLQARDTDVQKTFCPFKWKKISINFVPLNEKKS